MDAVDPKGAPAGYDEYCGSFPLDGRTIDTSIVATKYLKIKSQRGLDDAYELLGRNLSGAYLHVIYRVLPDRRLRVFHINTMTEAQKKRYRRRRK